MAAPEGYEELGLVGFTDKGDYNSSSTYYKNDLVHYQGSIYKLIVDSASNKLPTNTAYWSLFLKNPFSTKTFTLSLSSWDISNRRYYLTDGTFFKSSGFIYVITPIADQKDAYNTSGIFAKDISTDGRMELTFTDAENPPNRDFIINIFRMEVA